MLDEAREALERGQVAVFATDTVYGLAALPASAGYERIFDLKGRPRGQALPWIVADTSALDTFGRDVPDYAYKLASMFWPGALTLVIQACDEARQWGQPAADGTLALRCPDSDDLRAILRELGGPLACTSANAHGEPAACQVEEIPEEMRALPGGSALPEACAGGLASTIGDCTGRFPKILREGPIPAQVVLDVAVYGATL